MTAITVDAYVRGNLDEDSLKDEEIVSRVISDLQVSISADPEGDHSVGVDAESGERTYEQGYLNLASVVAAATRLDQVFGRGAGMKLIQSLLPAR